MPAKRGGAVRFACGLCGPRFSSILGFAGMPRSPSPSARVAARTRSAFRGHGCGLGTKTGGTVGDGAGCRENLRCLKPEVRQAGRATERGHRVFPAPSSVHVRTARGR